MNDNVAAVFAEIAGMGSQFGPEQMLRTRALFNPLVSEQPWARAKLISDLRYGEHPRHRLDLIPAVRAGSPVLIFLHGGGFIAGDKNGDGTFYCNVPRYFAANGYLGVAANYRLADTASWPAGAEDLSSVIRWVRSNAAQYGGDPERICLLGQSAGAAHTATWLFDSRFKDERRGAGIVAAALLSGFYQPEAPLAGGQLLYYGDNPRVYQRRSATTHVAPGHVPLLLSVAEYDPAEIAEHTLQLALALNRADGKPPPLVWLEGHNHVSAVHGVGVGEDLVGILLRNFFEQALGRPEPY